MWVFKPTACVQLNDSLKRIVPELEKFIVMCDRKSTAWMHSGRDFAQITREMTFRSPHLL